MSLPAWPWPPAAHLRQCRDVVTSAEQRQDTDLGAGGHGWRPTVTVNAFQSSPAVSQASSREFRHFHFPGEVIIYTH